MIKLQASKIVEALEDCGAEYAFGIPGGSIAGVFHSLSNSKKIRTVMTQHESAAGFMAIGCYLFSQRRSVPIVFTTAGPGAVNALTGVTAAWEEKVPLFLLTANVSSKLKGKRAAQDSYDTGINIGKMFSAVTARSTVLPTIEGVDRLVEELYALALRESMPVHLDIPGDISMAPLIAPARTPERILTHDIQT